MYREQLLACIQARRGSVDSVIAVRSGVAAAHKQAAQFALAIREHWRTGVGLLFVRNRTRKS